MAWLASPRFPRHDGFCHDGCYPTPGKPIDTQKNQASPGQMPPVLIRWSIQEIRRIAQRLKRRRINPAFIIMVAMATRPPGRRSRGAFQTQITTVMLRAWLTRETEKLTFPSSSHTVLYKR